MPDPGVFWGASLIAQLVKNPHAMQETSVGFLGWEDPLEMVYAYRIYTPVFGGFSCGLAGKESGCKVEDLGLIPGLGRSPVERKGYPCQYSGLENSMDCIVHGVAKSWTRLNDFHFHFWVFFLFLVFFCESLVVSLLNS